MNFDVITLKAWNVAVKKVLTSKFTVKNHLFWKMITTYFTTTDYYWLQAHIRGHWIHLQIRCQYFFFCNCSIKYRNSNFGGVPIRDFQAYIYITSTHFYFKDSKLSTIRRVLLGYWYILNGARCQKTSEIFVKGLLIFGWTPIVKMIHHFEILYASCGAQRSALAPAPRSLQLHRYGNGSEILTLWG